MATRSHIPSSDIENIHKHKTLLTGKTTVLGNKIPSRRPPLGERTNQEASKLNAAKPALKKPLTNILQNAKPKIIPQKTTINTLKPKEVTKEVQKSRVLEKEEKKTSYSVQHFGLIEEHETDPLLVPTYVNDIVTYLRNLELEYVVNEMFMTSHKTTPRMRCVLVNWLVDVHLSFKLVQETLFLCVSIIDRYLAKNKTVGRDNLQLVGISALFIASKYEEIYAPEIEDLVYICDNLFDKKKIILMEQSIIKALGFKFGSPCALHFLRRYSKLSHVETIHHILAKYLIELAIIEHEYSHVPPSLIAAAALCLSIRLYNSENVDEKAISVIEHISGYKQKDMGKIIRNLASSVLKTEDSKYKAVKNKYADKCHCSISLRTELKNGLIKKLAEMK